MQMIWEKHVYLHLEHWSALSKDAPKDDEDKPLGFLNVGTGVDLRISDLAEQIAKTVGFKGDIYWDKSKPDGTPKKQLDISRLSEIGWRSRITLAEGLEETVMNFKKKNEKTRGLNN